MQKTKQATSSPLPFQGQKRRWINLVRKVLSQYDDSFTYVDLFGGSGLLSHVTKTYYPKARVIYNDYDDFHKRIGHITETNKILNDLRGIVNDLPDDSKIPDDVKRKIIARLENEKGYVDWITVSSMILFSMKYCKSFDELKKQTFYNSIRKTDYRADGYLDGVEVVKMDYRTLFYQFKNDLKTVFIVDPPYLSTDVSSYNSVEYWKLKDYLDVLHVLQNTNFIYFTSEKSSLIELFEWLEINLNAINPFAGAEKVVISTNTSAHNKFRDIMLSKRCH